ncbi:YwqI/YxiC family protein [Rossellomorea sp. LjRoot5]|uniref:YwqI/YxiC family protein n=1 Tax=Rossellomorea sp. LjRoot5 TaxID=3342331 RepID=UPI003ECDB81B
MGEELKIRYSAVEQAVTYIDNASESLTTDIPSTIANDNRLDVTERINELNHQLSEIRKMYKELLAKNNQSVKQSLISMEEADRELSSSIKLR